MNPKHQESSARIRQHANKQLTERYDPERKLTSTSQLETYNPEIIVSTPIPPDPKLKTKIQHGS